jgi:glucose/arabinose dehydrogenase
LIAGLASRAIIRVEIDGDTAIEAERYDMGARIREVEQGPDGAVWVLEDNDGGRLLKLTPPDLEVKNYSTPGEKVASSRRTL